MRFAFALCLLLSASVSFAEIRFAIIGDTQRTSRLEKVLLQREDNKDDQAYIIEELSSEKPEFIVHVGDLTFDASSDQNWKFYDKIMEPVAKIPIWVALGNHEYWGNEAKSFSQLENRFPHLKKSRWNLVVKDNVAILLVDSNKSKLGNTRWNAQLRWYSETLAELNFNPKIRHILVAAHHPPYTNSTVTGDETHVQEAFLSEFFASSKTVAFVSGHAHGYERFQKNGKLFVVTGGGGGPRVTLKTGQKAKHEDLYRGPSPRPFNFVVVNATANSIEFAVKGMSKGGTKTFVMDRF